MAVQQSVGEKPQKGVVNRRIGQIDDVEAHFVADGAQRLFFADQPHFDCDLVQTRAVVLCRSRLRQLALVEQPASQQYFTSFHVCSVEAGGFQAGWRPTVAGRLTN
jgi:hypothetical protein